MSALNESTVEDATLRDTLLPKLLSGELSVGSCSEFSGRPKPMEAKP